MRRNEQILDDSRPIRAHLKPSDSAQSLAVNSRIWLTNKSESYELKEQTDNTRLQHKLKIIKGNAKPTRPSLTRMYTRRMHLRHLLNQ